MRSLIPTKCFWFKLSYFKSPLSKSSIPNFKRAYTLGKSVVFKSFNTVRLRTKNFSHILNLHIMSNLQNTTCTSISITETTNEVECTDSINTSNQHRRSSKKEKEKPRRHNCKESIKVNNSVHSVVNLVSTNQKYDNRNKSDYKKRCVNVMSNPNFYSNVRHYTVPETYYSIPGNLYSSPSTSLRFSNVFYHSLSDSQMNVRDYRSDAVDYSNSTRASQWDRQQAWALRSWKLTGLGKILRKTPPSSSNCTFKIMSYNVLAQELLERHAYLYQYHNRNAIEWQQRWFTLLNELKQLNADILCLQEVQLSHVENYYNQLHQLGYKSIFKRRTGERTDGCAIYYKSSIFKLVEFATVEFNQYQIKVLNRDNVAIIAKFAPVNNTKNEFVVATTHLLYNRRREDVRLAQTQVLLSEIDRIAYKPNENRTSKKDHLPVILTGDFNFSPESVVYKLLTTGVLKYDDLSVRSLSTANASDTNLTGKKLLPKFLRITDQCQHADVVEHRLKNSVLGRDEEWKLIQLQHSEKESANKSPRNFDQSLFSTGTLTHSFSLKSAYVHNHNNDTEATTHQDGWVTVDYIFYSSEVSGSKQHDRLKLLSRYTLPTTQQLQGVRIPNYAFGSDHFLLMVTFQLDP